MIPDISTSWNVVKLAYVFCDCFNLSPILSLILLNGYLTYCLSNVPLDVMKAGPLAASGFLVAYFFSAFGAS
jgi:hypothetical protein